MLLIALLATVPVTPALAATSDTVTVRVSIRTAERKPVPDAYIAFVPPNRPAWRPAVETIARHGVATVEVRPDLYQVFVSSKGFQESWRSVQVKSDTPLIFDLQASALTTGVVVDANGKPVAGATVTNLRAIGPVELGQTSPMARRYFAAEWLTNTDGAGQWSLPGRDDAAIPVRFEASGFSPVTEFRRSKEPSPRATQLLAGASLHLTLDRADPSIFITLRRDAKRGSDQELELEPITLTRAAETTSLTWPSLIPGTYRIIAQYLDPCRFADPRPIGTIILREHEAGELHATLPKAVAPAPDVVTLFVPGRPSDDLATLDAIVSTRTGPEEVRHSFERTSGGTLIHLRTAAKPSDVYLLTQDAIILPDRRVSREAGAPIPTLRSGRADATVRLMSGDTPMPRYLSASFGDCEGQGRFTFVAGIAPDGVLQLPYPTACWSLVLQIVPFEPVIIHATLATHDKRSFGPYTLKLGGTADIHVLRDPTGTSAANAVVRAFVASDMGVDQARVAEGVADDDGHVVLKGLPADRDLIIEAQEGMSDATGSTHAQVSAGHVLRLDVVIPLPATLSVAPRLAPAFRTRFPNARIPTVVMESDRDPSHHARRNVDVDSSGTALFEKLQPGLWHIVVLVEAAGTLQPLPAGDVDLRPGDLQQIDLEVEPAVFDGRVVRGGTGIAAQVGFGDPPAPGSVTRNARTDAQGRFTVLLPVRGTYRVSLTPIDRPDTRISIGEMEFTDPSRPVTIVVPAGSVAVRVKEHGEPVPGAIVTARLRRTTAYETEGEVARNVTTDGRGEARLSGLLDGRWLIEAQAPGASGSRAETSVMVVSTADDAPIAIELELQPPSALKGTVQRPNSTVVQGAAVNCLFVGPSGIPQVATTQSGADGHFAIDLTTPPPSMLRCGVVTAAGEIAAFTLGPTENADLVLPAETASLAIPDFGPRTSRAEYWLVSRDGKLFSLSWAEAKLGSFWAPLALSRVPTGSWKLVRTANAEQWIRLATAGGNALTPITEFRLEAGKTMTVRLLKSPDADPGDPQ